MSDFSWDFERAKIPGISEEFHSELVHDWDPVGSKATCHPVPEGTDTDYLIDVHDINEAVSVLEAEGFVLDAEARHQYQNTASFLSMRRGSVNLIITEDNAFFTRFVAATHVAKTLNLLHKEDRIMLFQAVLYGKRYCPKGA
jgi:hypothetical protein